MSIHNGLGEPRGPEFQSAPGLVPAVPQIPPALAGPKARWGRVLGTGLLIVAVSAGTGGLAGWYAGDQETPSSLQRAAPAPGAAPGSLVGVAEQVRAGVLS